MKKTVYCGVMLLLLFASQRPLFFASSARGVRVTKLSHVFPRIVISKSDKVEISWTMKTVGELHQVTRKYAISVRLPNGIYLLKTVVGQVLQLPLRGKGRGFKVTLEKIRKTRPGKLNKYRIKIHIRNARLEESGIYTVAVSRISGATEFQTSIRLIVLEMPFLHVKKDKIITGKHCEAVVKWHLDLRGDINAYMQINRELIFTIRKEQKLVPSNKMILYNKPPGMTRFPSSPNHPDAQQMYNNKRMKAISSFSIESVLNNNTKLFKQSVGLKFSSAEPTDTGNYTLVIRSPWGGKRIAKSIFLEVLDCLNSSCYLFHDNAANDWHHNRMKCQQEGGDLVRLETEYEWKFVQHVLLTKTNATQWKSRPVSSTGWHVGLIKSKGNRKWRWASLNTTVDARPIRRNQQKGGNTKSANDLCAAVRTGHTLLQLEFYSLPCSRKHAYICEFEKPL